MTQPVPVVFEPWDVNRRLAELGLDESLLVRANQRGLSAWASCTENHPPAFPGLSGWGETVCALREELKPRGWDRLNESNLPLTVNEAGTIAISVATGDEDTGRIAGFPRTSSAKGPRTVKAILENKQMDLPFPDTGAVISTPTEVRQTWILLIYRDREAGEGRCEFSRPISMDEEGHVDRWAERIILAPTQFDDYLGAVIEGGYGPQGPQTPEIEVEIRKRA